MEFMSKHLQGNKSLWNLCPNICREIRAQLDNTHHRGKYHCMTGLQFNKIEIVCSDVDESKLVIVETSLTMRLPLGLSDLTSRPTDTCGQSYKTIYDHNLLLQSRIDLKFTQSTTLQFQMLRRITKNSKNISGAQWTQICTVYLLVLICQGGNKQGRP